MRQLGLLAAAAGLALSGSVVKADFVISSSRTAGPTIGGQATDIVDFTVTNTNTGGTGSTINSIDIAMSSPNGLYVGARTVSSVLRPDVFFGNSGSANDSWIGDELGLTPGGTPQQPALGNTGNLTSTSGGNVLALGGNPTTTAGTATSSVVATANELFQAIAGTIFSTSGADASPLWFARAVVPTGQPVTLYNPGGTISSTQANSSRSFEPLSGTFSPLSGSFAATNNFSTPYTSAVPEPASLGLVGIGAAGLFARRRRSA